MALDPNAWASKMLTRASNAGQDWLNGVKNPARDPKQAARLQAVDVLMLDTAGRLHVDQGLMDEMRSVAEVANPTETLLVVDALTGQDLWKKITGGKSPLAEDLLANVLRNWSHVLSASAKNRAASSGVRPLTRRPASRSARR